MKTDINPQLVAYIEEEILPQYLAFDAAHQPNHALTVIEESMKLAEHYPVDQSMVYAIAAFHDTGLRKDRATHHLVSGEIIRTTQRLHDFFTADEIEMMAQAAEDHRASIDHEPRSIYGKIVAEADRCIDSHTIVKRTIQYGLSHYPNLDKEGHYARFIQHMKEKYAEGGYLKIWLEESANAIRLKRFQETLKDEKETRRLFLDGWDEIKSEQHKDA